MQGSSILSQIVCNPKLIICILDLGFKHCASVGMCFLPIALDSTKIQYNQKAHILVL